MTDARLCRSPDFGWVGSIGGLSVTPLGQTGGMFEGGADLHRSIIGITRDPAAPVTLAELARFKSHLTVTTHCERHGGYVVHDVR